MTIPVQQATACLPFSAGDLLTPDQVAAELGLSHRTLADWRRTKRAALPYVKVGGRVRYRRTDVAAFIARGLHTAANSEA